MEIWDCLRTLPAPHERQKAPPEPSKNGQNQFWPSFGEQLAAFGDLKAFPNSHEKTSTCNSFGDFGDFGRYIGGINLIPVVLELDGQGRVQVRCNSLKGSIQRFVSEHEEMLADILSDMPGRKWDSMTDRVEELTTRAQAIKQKAG